MMKRYFYILFLLVLLGCDGESLYSLQDVSGDVLDQSPSPDSSPAPSTPFVSTIFYEDFETGWGNFIDGGLYASLIKDDTGSNSVVSVFGNAGVISSLLQRKPMDLTQAESIRLQLYVQSEVLSPGDALTVDFSDGTQWHTIARVEFGDNSENQLSQSVSLSISNQDYTFTDSARIRLTGETNLSRIFVDNIYLTKVSFYVDEEDAILEDTIVEDAADEGIPFYHAGTEGCIGCHENRIAVGKSASHLTSSDDCRFCHIAYNPEGWVAYTYTSGTYDHTGVVDRCIDCHNKELAAGKPEYHIESSTLCENCHAPTIGGWNLLTPGETFWHDSVSGECLSCHNDSVAQGKGPDHIPSSDACEDCHTPNFPWSEVSF